MKTSMLRRSKINAGAKFKATNPSSYLTTHSAKQGYLSLKATGGKFGAIVPAASLDGASKSLRGYTHEGTDVIDATFANKGGANELIRLDDGRTVRVRRLKTGAASVVVFSVDHPLDKVLGKEGAATYRRLSNKLLSAGGVKIPVETFVDAGVWSGVDLDSLAATNALRGPMATAAALMDSAHPWDPIEEGRQMVESLKQAEGGPVDRVEAAKRLNLGLAQLYNRIKATPKEVITWLDAAGRFRFPSWQFGVNGMLPGVKECLATLADPTDDWAVMRFFLTPAESAGGKSPLTLLRDGNIAEATALARQTHHG